MTSVCEDMCFWALGRLATAIKNNHPPVIKYRILLTMISEVMIVSNILFLLTCLYSPKASILFFDFRKKAFYVQIGGYGFLHKRFNIKLDGLISNW
jgi:hypothetical protein